MGVAMTVYRGRQAARQSGRETYAAEASILDLPEAPGTAREQYDQDRAFAVGWSYSDYWARQYDKLGDPQKALEATDSRLRAIGVTEVAEATSDERDHIIRAIGAARETTGTLITFKVWDAALDRRTCPVCARAHHTVVPWFMDFPDGRPGGVHSNCRCYEGTILLPAWFDYETDIAA